MNLKQHNSPDTHSLRVYGIENGTQSRITHTRVVVTDNAKALQTSDLGKYTPQARQVVDLPGLKDN